MQIKYWGPLDAVDSARNYNIHIASMNRVERMKERLEEYVPVGCKQSSIALPASAEALHTNSSMKQVSMS